MDELVARLSEGKHKVSAERYKTVKELKEATDRDYVLIKFTETKGGTELGIKLDRAQSVLNTGDFEAGTGTVTYVGTLVLNYNEVEMHAEIDLSTLKGEGFLKLIADEAEWRAKQKQKQSA